jgi:uncharacterized protein (TIGR02284 family)
MAFYFPMISSDETAIRVLNNLIVIGRDAEKGFQTAAVEVRDPELARLFCEYASQRAKIVGDLQERVKTLREEPRKEGSILGKAHRKWMEGEAAGAEALSHTLLTEIERGEDLAVMAYREALEMRDLDEQTRKLIQRQYEQVQAVHDRVRQLRDSATYAHR